MALDSQRQRGAGSGATEKAAKAPSAHPQHQGKLQRLIAQAQAYHARHADWVREFNALTHDACAGDGGVSYRLLRNWQSEHHLSSVDGLLGPETLEAARHLGDDPGKSAPKKEPEHHHQSDPAAKVIAKEAEHAEHDPAPPTAAEHHDPKTAGSAPPVETATGEKKTAPAAEPVAPVAGGVTRHIYDAGSAGAGFQKAAVFVAPGGVTPTPDIFLFFHGHDAQYGIDPEQTAEKAKTAGGKEELRRYVKSGIDVAEQAMAQARGKNVIAILPQGVMGEGRHGGKAENEGGYMKGLMAGLPTFLSSILTPLAVDLHMKTLTPGRIAISGHSAGGYLGINEALGNAGALKDQITDITLMDTSYSESHFNAAGKWLFQGKAGKSLRIVGSKEQIQKNFHKEYFSEAGLKKHATAAGFTVEALSVAGDDRGNKTKAVQHSHVRNKDGAIHADVLILVTDLGVSGHHKIRDNVLDDAILSIGEGAEGSDSFGRREHGVMPGHAPEAAAGGGGGATHPEKAAAQEAHGAESHAAPAPAENLGGHEEHDAPVATHAEGDVTTPEKVVAKPAATSKVKSVGKEVYAAGGRLSKEHLKHHELSDQEFAFKQQVYDAAVARLGSKIYGGVNKEDLVPCDGGKQIRKDVAGPLASLLSAMRAAIKAGSPVGDKAIGKATGVHVVSGYRSPEADRDLWDSYFQGYMTKTAKARAATGDPLGPAAVKYMVQYIAWRKAPPGGSNHSNGTAVDLAMEMSGHHMPNNYDDQKDWKASWHYAWLKANASSMGFKNYIKEAWHWELKG